MRKIYTLLLCILFNVSVFKSQHVYNNYVDGKVYVKLTRAATKAILKEDPTNIPLSKTGVLSKVFAKYGVTKVYRPFHQAADDEVLPCIVKLDFNKNSLVDDLIRELKQFSQIEYAEKVPLMRTDATPNDPLYSSAVHLTQIGAANAWNVFNSTANGNSTITVAIVDNAVMWTHADLVANTYTNTGEIPNNNVDDDGNGYKDDVNGYDVTDNDNNTLPTNLSMNHGTHCAGIAGARTDNNLGIASIGWNVRIIPVKCETDNGATTTVANGYEGIVYAVKAKAKIISCSWGGSTSSATEQSVINYAWNRGRIVMASAGNNGNNVPNYPGAYNNVYCVGWVDPSDVKASLSNYGTYVDVSAPGSNINSTVPYSSTPAYQQLSGTSMATPMVAGLAALMLSKSPNMTRADVLNCISSTATNIYTLSGNSAYVSGNQLGAGRINAFAAMNCAATYSALPPVANFYAFPLYTCPNTSITLYDSSLYSPTTWNWVFQGGSPATSTLANPVVQWSSPGTYSVSLTVSNASGTNTATKLSYINVAGALPLPFVEGFENPQFLPANWSANNIANDPIFWDRTTTCGGFGTSTACAIFDNFLYFVANERDEVRSPKFNMSNVGLARIRFDVAYARYDATFSDSLEVKISTNCGSTWNSVYLKGGTGLATAPDKTNGMFVPTSTQWRRDSVDVSTFAAGQGNVMFSFINRGRYGQPIYVDNINIATPVPTLSIISPANVCNNSPATFSFATTGAASYTWSLPGSSVLSSTLANPVVSYPTAGIYTVTLVGANGNSSTSVTSTISIVSSPSINLNAFPSNTVCSGSSATISASGASSYSWSTGAAGNQIVVTPSTNTIYSVTGGVPGCSNTQTILLTTGGSGLSVNIAATSSIVCVGSSATLSASGASSYTWSTGATGNGIVVTPTASSIYSVNGSNAGCTGNSTITLTVAPTPVAVISTTNAGCGNGCNGVVDAVCQVGTSPFTFSLGGASTPCGILPCTNLCQGLYTLYTTDSYGCKTFNIFTLSNTPNNVTSAISTTNASCASCADGALTAGVSGGLAPYSYTWSPSGGNGPTASALLPGCYTVSILDSQNCSSETQGCVTISTGLGSNAIDINALNIFPNPGNGEVNVIAPNQMFDVMVYNQLGQLVILKTGVDGSTVINTSALAKGVYLLEAAQGKTSVRKKLVVE
ncbi:MAG: S8 family serine peptidase [Bacteroidia bacterium]|nr:S8 family serine peptidase [Bacteroidia bacterium]